MANGPKVNCDMCGRDTTNKSRICRHCTGGRSGAMLHEKTSKYGEWWDEQTPEDQDKLREYWSSKRVQDD